MCPYSGLLQQLPLRSLTRKLQVSKQYFLISISTQQFISNQANLRVTLDGARYHQVRMAYYPYTQVIRAVGLTTVQASISRKGDFTLPRHRSLGFGSGRRDLSPFRLAAFLAMRGFAFAPASRLTRLTSPQRQTPSLVLRDERHDTDQSHSIQELLLFNSRDISSLMPCPPMTV